MKMLYFTVFFKNKQTIHTEYALNKTNWFLKGKKKVLMRKEIFHISDFFCPPFLRHKSGAASLEIRQKAFVFFENH